MLHEAVYVNPIEFRYLSSCRVLFKPFRQQPATRNHVIGFVVQSKHPTRFDLTLKDFVDDMDDLHTHSIVTLGRFDQ